MNKRQKKRNQKPGAPLWMVTYSDLMTLILVFFVLLFSMSQIDLVKFKAVAQSFNNRVIFDFYPSVIPLENPALKSEQNDVQNEVDSFPEPTDSNRFNKNENAVSDNSADDGKDMEEQRDQLQEVLEEIQAFLEANGLSEFISANRNERGVVLVLQEKVLYNTGEAEILRTAVPFLDKVGTLLKAIPNPVKVEGHTDDRPIATYRFPSNWELSGARASSVIRYLAEHHDLDPKRFTSVGYGSTRPLVENNGEENWQINRRVEIVITDPAYSEKQAS